MAAALAAALLVMSCGGNAGTSGAGASAGASSAPTAAATSAPTKAATSAPSAASGPALASLLSSAKLAEYKVTYKITATGSGASFSGEQSWYFKPPRSRFDFRMDFGGATTTMMIFGLTDGTYMCFATGGPTQCLTAPATGSPLDQNLAASFQSQIVNDPGKWGGTFTGSRTIAGQNGLCYDVKAVSAAAGGLTEGSFCWSDKGIPLLSSFKTADGAWTMEATSVSTSVPDSDFTLPATPAKLP